VTGVSTLVGDGHAHVEDSQGVGMDRARNIQGSNTGECPIFMGKLWRKSLVERICLDYPLLDLTTRVGGNVFSTNELIESHFQH
jgi:hypothetical protein